MTDTAPASLRHLQAPLLPGGVSDPVIVASHLRKVYGTGSAAVVALDDVSVEVAPRKLTAIVGRSGSGKSTLMHCLAGLDTPTSGVVVLDGHVLAKMNDNQLTALRRDKVGFIFQSFNLVPTLTARENILLPATIAGAKVPESQLDSIASAVNIQNRLDHLPGELSGGQQQRAACARALLERPAVVFADEPTGNLDSQSAEQLLRLLRQAVDEFEQTVVLVTHDPTVAAWADRVIFISDGILVGELRNPTPLSVLTAMGRIEAPLDSPLVEPDVEAYLDIENEEAEPVGSDPTEPPAAESIDEPSGPDSAELPPSFIEENLDEIAPAVPLPSEAAEVVNQARQILGELAGSVIDVDEE